MRTRNTVGQGQRAYPKDRTWPQALADGWGIEEDSATGWWWIKGPGGGRREARRGKAAAQNAGAALAADDALASRIFFAGGCTDPAVQAQAPAEAEIQIFATNFVFEIPGHPGTRCRRIAAWAVQRDDGDWHGVVGFITEPGGRVVGVEDTAAGYAPSAVYREQDALADAVEAADNLIRWSSRQTDGLDGWSAGRDAGDKR